MKSSHVEPGLSPAVVSPSVHIPQTPIVDSQTWGLGQMYSQLLARLGQRP